MKGMKKRVILLLSFLLAFGGILQVIPVSAAGNDYVYVTKTVNPSTITTEDEEEVSLGIQGTPPANVVVPNDVILIIDKSGSMQPQYNNGEDKMKNAKEAAKGFVDLMDLTKHKVGIVDFSSSNNIGTFGLTDDKTAVKNYIDGITANGSTATGDAIQVATDLLANHRPEAQPVIVLLTDGDANQGGSNPYDYAKQKSQEAKDQGIIFYTIALLSPTDNPDASGPNILLKEMATTANHHHFVLGSSGLSEIYAAIVKEIGIASAYDVTVTDVVSPDFEIVPGSYDDNIPKPTVNGNTLIWQFNELKNSTLTFKYKIRPVSKTKTGYLQVSTSDSVISYKDYAGAARTKAIPSALVKVNLPAPTITSIVEPVGHPAGGETVTINGSHFLPGATVKFGDYYATNVQVVSSDVITVTAPAGKQGNASVVVTNPDAQTATGQYQYKGDPVVTSIIPDNGPLEGGTVVIIKGNYFMPGMKVKFGDKDAAVLLNNGLNFIQVTAPAGDSPGKVDLTLTNPDGSGLTVPQGYTYNEPPKVVLTITTLTPASGPNAGGTVVSIIGSKFVSGAKVYFGNNEATVYNTYPNKLILATPASQQAQTVDVKVVNPDGEEATLTQGYTYLAPPPPPAPTITTLSPASGPNAGGTVVSIIGSNFVSGVKVYFGNNQATVYSTYPNKLILGTPASQQAQTVDVKVVNPDGQEATLTQGYTYLAPPPPPAPTITALTPASGPNAGGTVVNIDGTNFVSGAKAYFGDQLATVVTTYPYRLIVTTPAYLQGGVVDVKVVNPDGQEVVNPGAYTYTLPLPEPVTITSISPNTGLTLGGDVVYINGTNFKQGATVMFGNTPVTATLTNATKLWVTAPATTVAGPIDVTVTNLDGQTFTLTNGYTYLVPAPTITSLSSNHGPLAGGTVVNVVGSNFDPKMTVTVNNIPVPITIYYSSSKFTIITPSSISSGGVPIVVTLPSGTSASGVFTYDAPPPVLAPTITSLDSRGTSPSGGYAAYINGTGFAAGLKVYYGNTQATLIQLYSANRLMVMVPAGVGTVPIKIVNPDGQVSNLYNFTYQ